MPAQLVLREVKYFIIFLFVAVAEIAFQEIVSKNNLEVDKY